MLIFTALFAGLMLLSAHSRRRIIAISLIGCLAMLVIAPAPAQGQLCLPCIIQAVLDTINKVIGNWLNAVNGVLTNIRNFYQQVVWPLNLINQAKAQITSMICAVPRTDAGNLRNQSTHRHARQSGCAG